MTLTTDTCGAQPTPHTQNMLALTLQPCCTSQERHVVVATCLSEYCLMHAYPDKSQHRDTGSTLIANWKNDSPHFHVIRNAVRRALHKTKRYNVCFIQWNIAYMSINIQ